MSYLVPHLFLYLVFPFPPNPLLIVVKGGLRRWRLMPKVGDYPNLVPQP